MSDKALAEIVVRALLAIIAGIRKKYGLHSTHNDIVIVIQERPEEMPLPVGYNVEVEG